MKVTQLLGQDPSYGFIPPFTPVDFSFIQETLTKWRSWFCIAPQI